MKGWLPGIDVAEIQMISTRCFRLPGWMGVGVIRRNWRNDQQPCIAQLKTDVLVKSIIYFYVDGFLYNLIITGSFIHYSGGRKQNPRTGKQAVLCHCWFIEIGQLDTTFHVPWYNLEQCVQSGQYKLYRTHKESCKYPAFEDPNHP